MQPDWATPSSAEEATLPGDRCKINENLKVKYEFIFFLAIENVISFDSILIIIKISQHVSSYMDFSDEKNHLFFFLSI